VAGRKNVPAGTSDYYQTLGVERGASADEIKRAFRRKARELHPDVNRAADAEDRFKEINEAYDVLSDPAKREQYDRFGSVGRAGAPGGYQYVDLNDLFGGGSGGGFDMGDLFSAFFGGVYGGGAGRGVRLEGRDMAMSLAITLEEAATGAEKEIVLDRLAPCDVCGASGSAAGSSAVVCPDCHGTGQKVSMRKTFLGTMQTSAPCDRCGATGRVIERPCEECQGSGRVPDRQHVTVSIPTGIHDGQQIRLRSMGEAGIRGASAGDLIVTVRVKPHEYLHREGDDLHCKASVSITQAALGADLKVCGLLEDNEVHVPGGTQHGDTLRMKGRGMPRWGGSGRGDLIVHVGINVPKRLSKRQKELLRELAEELGDQKQADKNPLHKLRDWLTG
jgi:molecular chaperone DnaJ